MTDSVLKAAESVSHTDGEMLVWNEVSRDEGHFEEPGSERLSARGKPMEEIEVGVAEEGSATARRNEGKVETSEPARDGTGGMAPQELNQSLARLELNSLEVKLYLDSIDQRISRMEPRLEGLRDTAPAQEAAAAQPPVSAQPSGETGEPAPSADETFPEETTTERRRRAQGVPTVERRRAPHTVAVELEEAEPWDWKPWVLAHQKWLGGAALGLVAVAVLLYWGSGPRTHPKSPTSITNAGQVLVSDATTGAQKSSADVPWNPGGGAGAGQSHVPVRSANPNRSGDVIAGSTIVEQGVAVLPSSVAGSAIPAQPPPVQTTAPLPNSAVTGTEAASSQPPVAGSTGSASDSGPADPVSRAGSTSSGKILPQASGRVHVSSGVMAGNLIYSRQPAYPHGFASLFHTQGKVVLQAIISRNGRVENLRVLSGHYMLRGAAKQAVRTWRYRPYYVSGNAVEVATIISVEFHR